MPDLRAPAHSDAVRRAARRMASRPSGYRLGLAPAATSSRFAVLPLLDRSEVTGR